MKNTSLLSASRIVIFLVALLAINFIVSLVPLKLDFTSGQLYTLSEGSRKIVKGIDDEATIKYFFSFSSEGLPISVKNYGNRVREVLEEFSNLSDYITLEIINPTPDSDEEEMATKYGVKGVPVGDGVTFYMGAVLIYQDKNFEIPFFDPRKEAFLEYDIASLLSKLKDADQKKMGVLAGFPLKPTMKDNPYIPQPVEKEQNEWVFVDELNKLYDMTILDISVEEIPTDIDLLLVLHPVGISEATEYAVEQFILKGGRAVVVVDPSAATLPEGGNQQIVRYGLGKNTDSNMPKLFNMIGVEFSSPNILVDKDFATSVNTRMGAIQYPVWITLSKKAFSQESIATANLNTGLFIEAGFFKPKGGFDGNFTSLLNSSKNSGSIMPKQAQTLISKPNGYLPINKVVSLAGVAKGKFKSQFEGTPKGSAFSVEHVKEAQLENSVFVIGDVDFLNNKYALSIVNFFGQSVVRPKNQNIAFFNNGVEFLAGNPDLISIRSRGSFSRPFDKLKEIQKEAQVKWHGVEEELTQKVQALQQKLNTLQSKKTADNRFEMSDEQKVELQKFKMEQLKVKKERRQVRKKLRQDIESLGNVLAAVNIGVVPFIVLIFGLWVYFRRTHRKKIVK